MISNFTRQIVNILLFFVIAIYFEKVFAAPINGVLTDLKNKPIANAFVYSQNMDGLNSEKAPPYAFSDRQGRFRLELPSKILFISHPAFLAKIVRVEGTKNNYRIKLQPTRKSDGLFDYCSTDITGTSLGKYLLIPTLQALSIDFAEREGVRSATIHLKGDQDAGMMIIASSRGRTFGFPSEQLILDSKSYSVRSFKVGKSSGVDISGVLENERLWRFISIDSSITFEYTDIDAGVANTFDILIKNICTPKP